MKIMYTIHVMNISALDLNLIPVLHALLEEAHVTRAAQRAGLSQPAMSHALKRLRVLLKDPLLVRSGGGMVLTPAAARLRQPIARLTEEIQRILIEPEPFEPATWSGVVNLGSNDFTEMVLVAELAGLMNRQAPNFRINGLILGNERPDVRLAAGDMDMALGHFPNPEFALYRKSLFRERFVSIVRSDHPLADAWDLDVFTRLGHVLVAPGGVARGVVDDVLEGMGRSRTIAVVAAHFLTAPVIVANSDLVCTLPERAARKLAHGFGVRILDPPIPINTFDLHLLWHERTHKDPALAWARGLLVDLTADW